MADLKTTGAAAWTLQAALADMRRLVRAARAKWQAEGRTTLRLHVDHPEYTLGDGTRLECWPDAESVGIVHARRYRGHDEIRRYEMP